MINYHITRDEPFPYWFVLYLTLEMLHVLNYLHKCQIIHADIKVDNLLIDTLPTGDMSYFDDTRTKCLVLIDYNRSIDLGLLPASTEFVAKNERKSLQCSEMRANRPWTFQIDYYGIVSSIYCIIFRKYMTTYTANGRNRIPSSVPRQYDELYDRLFDSFLNIASCQELPRLKEDFIKYFSILFKAELDFCGSFRTSAGYLASLSEKYSAFRNNQSSN